MIVMVIVTAFVGGGLIFGLVGYSVAGGFSTNKNSSKYDLHITRHDEGQPERLLDPNSQLATFELPHDGDDDQRLGAQRFRSNENIDTDRKPSTIDGKQQNYFKREPSVVRLADLPRAQGQSNTNQKLMSIRLSQFWSKFSTSFRAPSVRGNSFIGRKGGNDRSLSSLYGRDRTGTAQSNLEEIVRAPRTTALQRQKRSETKGRKKTSQKVSLTDRSTNPRQQYKRERMSDLDNIDV